jgi:superfamily II DNA or RNA helicase
MELLPHQSVFLSRNLPKDLLAHGTGTGKSLTIKRFALRADTSLLLICPKGLVSKWERELVDFPHEHIVMSKERFRKEPPVIQYGAVAVDEAHHFLTPTSSLHKALLRYVINIPYVLLATATPHRSSPWNLYAAGRLLGRDWDYSAFRRKYFIEVFIGWMLKDGKKIPRKVWRPNKAIDAELQASWRRLGHFVPMEEIIAMPEDVYIVEDIELTSEQKKALKYVFDPIPAVENGKRHQIEQGAVKSDGYGDSIWYKNGKVERILELASEFDKLIIVCQFTEQMKMLKEELSAYKTFIINGQSKESHDELARRAESLEKCVVLIQSSVGAGFELPSFPVMVFASMDYSHVSHTQMLGRNKRMNRPGSVLRVYLIAGEIDKAVYDCIMEKRDFNIGLYASSTKIS